MPLRKIFLSRWAALLWAGGVMWAAVDTIGFGPPAHSAAGAVVANSTATSDEDATGSAVDRNDLAILANAMRSE